MKVLVEAGHGMSAILFVCLLLFLVVFAEGEPHVCRRDFPQLPPAQSLVCQLEKGLTA